VTKILFVDRDGTLIEEPPDEQVDSLEKIRFLPGVFAALGRLVANGYRLVMVTNQDGLGTPSFPQASFDGPQNMLLQILRSQGIVFSDMLIDGSFAHEGKDTRKPGIGMLRSYLAADDWSRAASAVIGDRETDVQLAVNLGLRSFRLGPDWNWDAIAHVLCDAPRIAEVERSTKETRIRVKVDLDRRVLLQELDDSGRDVPASERRRYRYGEQAARFCAGGGEAFLRIGQVRQDALGSHEELLAGIREKHAARAAVEELGSELGLERIDPPRHR
jgi:histidinol-phosphatase